MQSNNTVFDQLDQTVIESLPHLSIHIVTVFNKMAELFKTKHEDFEKCISANIKNSKWELFRKSELNLFKPFTEEYYSNTKKITVLSPYFSLENRITIKHKKANEWLYFEYGYWMQNYEDNAFDKLNSIYFAVYRDENAKKNYKQLLSPAFYSKLKKNLISKNVYSKEIEIQHPKGPDKDRREEESFWIYQDEISTEKFEHNFQLYIDIVIKEYIANLPLEF